VLRTYAGPEAEEDAEIGDLVEDLDLDYARVYFDSAPDRHRRAWRMLYGLGDDSSTYLWRVLAARRIMRLWRRDPERLARLAELQRVKPSAEQVLHPEAETAVFGDAEDLGAARAAGELRPLPTERHGLYRDPQERGHALRPPALALAAWMGERVRRVSRGNAPLTVTRTVGDRSSQRRAPRRPRDVHGADSLHTTGFAFDVLRHYPDPGQADAFQFVLDRLEALNLIAWTREPDVIHVTVSSEARVFCALYGDLC
jgi:hypothetical protein